jgi:hypothetical protein
LSLIYAPVDGRDFLNPPTPLGVFQIENLVRRPMKVIGHEGYLLVERFEGVA